MKKPIAGSAMTRRSLLTAGTALMLSPVQTAFARDVNYKVLGQDRGHVALVNEKGEIEWEAPCPGTTHDLSLLSKDTFLIQTNGSNVVEMNRKGETLWKWDAKPKAGYNGRVEIHAFQRLPKDLTMISESGNNRIIEVNKAGEIIHEVPLTIESTDPHRGTRMARKLKNGTYLVCHEGDGVVREYDKTGKVIWSYKLDLNNQPRVGGHDGHGTEVFGAIRRGNGNTLIAGGNNNRVIEVDRGGKVIWSVEREELPGIRLYWVTTLQELPNGNLIIGNTHAGPDNPQLIEVNREKKVVWTFKNHQIFGNDLAAAQVVGVRGVNR